MHSNIRFYGSDDQTGNSEENTATDLSECMNGNINDLIPDRVEV